MGALTVVLREAVQNSWDARVGSAVAFSIHYFRPDETQKRALLETVFVKQPKAARLREQISQGPFGVLVFSDRGTSGLNGPIRADTPVDEVGAPRNFVDFMFDIGRDEGKGIGGGTYGFGKSSFFSLSIAGTVCVHTRCVRNGAYEERLMAAHLGTSAPGRTTGRAWWGAPGNKNPEPVIDAPAAALASSIGLPAFTGDECGTTIMVLGPRLATDGDDRPAEERTSVKEVIASLGTSIVQWFWPKMIPGRNGTPAITFRVIHEATELQVRPPASYPPYSIFSEALSAIDEYRRSRAEPADGKIIIIQSQRPAAVLGHLCLLRRPKRHRSTLPGDFEEESARELADQSHHVALLRGPRLVVRYLAGPKPPSELVDIAGVFIVDESSMKGDVENAFALSEPPVHDDWVAAALESRNHKTYVRIALKRIREQLGEFVLPFTEPGAEASAQPGLGAFSEMMGGLLATTTGTGARAQKPQGGAGGGGGGSGTGKPRITVSAGSLQLHPQHGRILSVPFTVESGAMAGPVEIKASACVLLDSGTEVEPPTGTVSPVIKSIILRRTKDAVGEVYPGSLVRLDRVPEAAVWEAIATVPADARVKVTLNIAEAT